MDGGNIYTPEVFHLVHLKFSTNGSLEIPNLEKKTFSGAMWKNFGGCSIRISIKLTWRIIPWLLDVVNTASGDRCCPLTGVLGPLPNGRTLWLLNGGYQLLTNWDDPASRLASWNINHAYINKDTILIVCFFHCSLVKSIAPIIEIAAPQLVVNWWFMTIARGETGEWPGLHKALDFPVSSFGAGPRIRMMNFFILQIAVSRRNDFFPMSTILRVGSTQT